MYEFTLTLASGRKADVLATDATSAIEARPAWAANDAVIEVRRLRDRIAQPKHEPRFVLSAYEHPDMPCWLIYDTVTGDDIYGGRLNKAGRAAAIAKLEELNAEDAA